MKMKSNKQNPRDKTLDLTLLFYHKPVTSLKNHFCMHKAGVCPVGFGATFAAVFVFIYQLREFALSAVNNRFE